MVTDPDLRAWGRLPVTDQTNQQLSRTIALPQRNGKVLPRGMGRSYGDVCITLGGTLWLTQGLDRMLHFDPETGILDCEPGVLLGDIQRIMIGQGWALPVTPGSQFVSVGGAIANDVHGKNHHAQGSFCDHVNEITLHRTDGEVIVCGPEVSPEWFSATAGGMGLTGVIRGAKLRLMPIIGPWLDCEKISFNGLADFFSLCDTSEVGWAYTVSWIDGLSGRNVRGLFMRANSVSQSAANACELPQKTTRTLLFPPPISIINTLSVRAFNGLYFHAGKWTAGHKKIHYQQFFYPLDAIGNWNQMYGPRGFFQFQCVLPSSDRELVTGLILDEIKASGQGSFLVVLKTFGDRPSPGLMSFSQAGVTLAMDFTNLGARTIALLARLHAIVADAKGRIYPAKDAQMPRALFEAGYPNLSKFRHFRDPGISSALSQRLLGD